MNVPDDIRKCVCFVGLRLANGEFRLLGTAFFLGRDLPGKDDADPMYAVTARHILAGVKKLGLEEVWLRVNLNDGAKWLRTNLTEWFSHPTEAIDVAVLKCGLPKDFDHLVYPYSLCIDDKKMRQSEVGVGDEVFITGLFRHHHGSQKNIPIVRVGNLACMTEEKITTQEFGEIDAYLIEARSIGGLSGSPVFLNLGATRVIGGQLKFAKGNIHHLMGLIHGHYDSAATSEAADRQEDGNLENMLTERVNTGIAIVVPFHSIDLVITAYESTYGALPALSKT